MYLVIKDTQHPFEREIINIFNLFKEDHDELIFKDHLETNVDNVIDLTYSYETSHLKAAANALVDHKKYTFTHERVIDQKDTDKELRKKAKQAISYVWLKLLEEITGVKQGWGILTGIRPTKLYHMLLKSLPHEQVMETLQNDYLLNPEKISLLRRIVEKQLSVLPDLYRLDEEVSLYIGIPFCPTKCAYCTFPAYALNYKGGIVEPFLKELHWEIEQIGSWLKQSGRKVTTVYFGGGTPTSIHAYQLDGLLEQLNRWIDLKSVREITVEAGRPDTITAEKLEVLKKWGIERISINPQTFIPETLQTIGRHHTVEETVEKFLLAKRMNFTNINMDLIIGLPGEGLKELAYSLKQIEKLNPESLTIHTMAFKRASYLTKNKEYYEISAKSEIFKIMEYAKKWTEDHEYFPYYLYRQKNILGNQENIGYSLKNKESLYNILIMEERQTIIGLGSGAVSKLISPHTEEIIRFPNPKEPISYIETIESLVAKKIEKLNGIFQNLT